jgi:hypothetical protein
MCLMFDLLSKQDEKSTFSKRKERNDAREIKSFYEK